MGRKRVKVVLRNGWVYINGEPAQLMNVDVVQEGLLGDTGRYCYRSPTEPRGIIVKFNDSHYRQSEKEIRKWKNMPEEDKKYFPKILDWKEGRQGWIAMEEETIRHKKIVPKRHREDFLRLVTKYKLRDVMWDCANNWAIREDGSLLIYDFGL